MINRLRLGGQYSPSIEKYLRAYCAVESKKAGEDNALQFISPIFILNPLPYSKPELSHFTRTNGHFKTTILGHPDFGVPYGSLARLLLIWLSSEAIANKSHSIYLGKSFSAFLKNLGMSTRGGPRSEAPRVREQLLRLLTCTISFQTLDVNKQKKSISFHQQSIISSFDCWWDKAATDTNAQIVLSNAFYDELQRSAVPVDRRIIHALRKSPLQMDLYIWLNHRFSYLHEEVLIRWFSLAKQFGNYSESPQGLRDFKRQFKNSIGVIKPLYSEAKIDLIKEGIILNKSPTHVQKKTGHIWDEK